MKESNDKPLYSFSDLLQNQLLENENEYYSSIKQILELYGLTTERIERFSEKLEEGYDVASNSRQFAEQLLDFLEKDTILSHRLSSIVAILRPIPVAVSASDQFDLPSLLFVERDATSRALVANSSARLLLRGGWILRVETVETSTETELPLSIIASIEEHRSFSVEDDIAALSWMSSEDSLCLHLRYSALVQHLLSHSDARLSLESWQSLLSQNDLDAAIETRILKENIQSGQHLLHLQFIGVVTLAERFDSGASSESEQLAIDEEVILGRVEYGSLRKLLVVRDGDANAAVAVPDTAVSMASTIDDLDNPNLTMAQRIELRRQREDAEKQKRLQEFLHIQRPREAEESSSLADDAEPTANIPIKARFEEAKRKQQKQEEERLAKLRNDPLKNVTSRRTSVKEVQEVWKEKEALQSSPPPFQQSQESEDKSVHRQGSFRNMRSMWNDVLESSKNQESTRFEQTKKMTISGFRLTDGTGMVRGRIEEWEELIMQSAATAEQMENFLKRALELSARYGATKQSASELHDAQRRFRESCLVPEDFVINDTHIYPTKVLDPAVQSYLKKNLAEARSANMSLVCGVYGETASKPPIEVFAALIKTGENMLYISLTVTAAPGVDTSVGADQSSSIFGVKKVVVMGKDSSRNVFEKLINVIPSEGAAALSSDSLDATDRDRDGDRERDGERDRESAQLHVGASQQSESESQVQVDRINSEEGEALEGEKASEDRVDTESAGLDVAIVDQDVEIIEEEESAEEEEENDDSVLVDGAAVSLSPSPAALDEEAESATQRESGDNGNNVSLSLDASANDLSGEDDEGNGTWVNMASPVPAEDAESASQSQSQSQSHYHHSDYETDDPSDAAAASSAHSPGKVASAILDEENEDGDDDQEPDITVMEADDAPCNFGRDLSLPNVSVPRVFVPARPGDSLSSNVHQMKKLSWAMEDEAERNLPVAQHVVTHMSVRDALTTTCCANLFVIETKTHCVLFTGTMKRATTESKYVCSSSGDSVFEWVRGAAASGWLLKWPMKSQKFGRRRWRFFVLRDHMLSYHASRPQTEEEIMSGYTKTTIHLTENSTVSVGRKFLQKCLQVTTPIDTLWVRMRNEYSSDSTHWMSEINKAIALQARPRLFMTKPRVESKWHHESLDFQLVCADTLSERGKYVKAALFCYKERRVEAPKDRRGSFERRLSFVTEPVPAVEINQYFSVDIGGADFPRVQLEILKENESAKLPTQLSALKLFGEVLLLGGSRGYLGAGVVSRVRPDDADESDASAAATAGNAAAANKTPQPQAPPQPLPGRKVLFALPFDADPAHYPHRDDPSNSITAIGVGSGADDLFAAADSDGVLSLWTLRRERRRGSEADSFNPMITIANTAANPALQRVAKRLRPHLLSRIDLSQLDMRTGAVEETDEQQQEQQQQQQQQQSTDLSTPSAASAASAASDVSVASPSAAPAVRTSIVRPSPLSDNSKRSQEVVTKLVFCCDDSLLFVCTTRRLLAFTLRSIATPLSAPLQVVDTADKAAPTLRGWVEIDRSLPDLFALFDVFAAAKGENGTGSGTGSESTSRQWALITWRVAEVEDSPSNAGVKNASSIWSDASSLGPERKCSVSRLQWTHEMLLGALGQLRAMPSNDQTDGANDVDSDEDTLVS